VEALGDEGFREVTLLGGTGLDAVVVDKSLGEKAANSTISHIEKLGFKMI
jgi:hypothetical protein